MKMSRVCIWTLAVGVSLDASDTPLFGQVVLGEEKTISGTEVGAAESSVGVGVDGSFVVTWKEVSPLGTRISARAYDRAGSARSDAIQLEEDPNGILAESRPEISFDERNGFYRAAWTSYDGLEGLIEVRSRRLSPVGDLLGVELSVPGDTVFGGGAFVPALEQSGTGRWILGWSSSEPNGIDVAAYSQVFEGENPVAAPLRMNQETFGYYSDVRVATDPVGNSVVTWLADYTRLGEPVVRGQRVSRDGVRLGDEFSVASEAAGAQFLCDVAMDSSGRFVVAWEQFDEVAAGSRNVYARRFDAEGAPLGVPFRVPAESDGAQYDCDLAMNREGDFVVTWVSDLGTEESLEDAYVRAFRTDGTPYGPALRVDEPRPSELFWLAGHPSVSVNDAGVFVVVWEAGPSDLSSLQIFARKYALPCSGLPNSLCLNGGRNRLHADWWVRDELTNDATALPISDETGGFWFFRPDIPELFVKVLDGCGSNGSHWIYAAGLTDVEVHLAVTDTETGEIWQRVNPWLAPFAPLQDIEALGSCAESNSGPPAARGSADFSAHDSFSESPPAIGESQPGVEACVPTATTLCLAGGRFEVSATFVSWAGGATAYAEPLSAHSGMFWFFTADNLELFVKIVDACAEFDHFWVFATGLTNLEVELTVRDRWAGRERIYPNALGAPFELIRDVSSFDTCSAGGG